MAQGSSRRCAFCGGPGPLTREHVLRDKFNVDLNGTPTAMSEIHQVFDRTTGEMQETRRTMTGRPFSATVRAVCATCNNGWMNDLENRAEEDLLKLIRGETIEFTLAQRETIALWAAKTALVRQLKDNPSIRRPLVDQFAAVRAQTVPWGTWTFATPAEPSPMPQLRSSQAYVQAVPDGEPASTLITTIHIERLLMVVVMPEDRAEAERINDVLSVMEVPVFETIHPSTRLIDWASRREAPIVVQGLAVEMYLQLLGVRDVPRRPPQPLPPQQLT